MSTLRLLLDQMIDAVAAKRVSEQGHDVVRLADLGMAEADDDEVLARAKSLRGGRPAGTPPAH